MADEVWEIGHVGMVWGGETVAEIVPEGDAEFIARFCQAEESIAAIAPDVAARAAADLAPGDLAADIVLGSVGVQRDLRAVEDEEEFRFVGMEAGEQTIEGDEVCASLEDAVEAGMHPTKTMRTDVALSGVITDDRGRGKEAVRLDAPPERAFGGDAHGVGRDVERGNAQV